MTKQDTDNVKESLRLLTSNMKACNCLFIDVYQINIYNHSSCPIPVETKITAKTSEELLEKVKEYVNG